MSLTAEQIQRFQRQLLLAPIGGAGQERISAATILLHGKAPLCRRYLEGAGVGCVTTSGEADLVVDLEDGAAFDAAPAERLWGGVVDGRVRVGCDPIPGSAGTPAERAVVEVLAAGEALWRLLGHPPHAYDFAL